MFKFTSNLAHISTQSFAAPESVADEFQNLRNIILGNTDARVGIDENGTPHAVSSSIDTGNMSTIDESNRFAGEDDTASLPFHRPTVAENAMAGVSLTADNLIDTAHGDGGTVSSLQSSNLSSVSDERFAAAWYESTSPIINSATMKPMIDNAGNPVSGKRLFEIEKATMLEKFPNAMMGKLETTGEIYWKFDAQIDTGHHSETWIFLVKYDNNHPHADNWGGSCRAYPIVPSVEEIRERARAAGRGFVPHIVRDTSQGMDYLCTISKANQREYLRKGLVQPAAQVAARSVWWATNYLIGLEDQAVWDTFKLD